MSEELRLPKFMKGDRVRTLDTGDGFYSIKRVIPYVTNGITMFNYELSSGITIGEESITEVHQEGEF